MHDDRSHPLLAQLPLTVSPFLSLPTATTLPYTYKPLPSTLPESVIDTPTTSLDPASSMEQQQNAPKPQYVISPTSHHAAHPDDIINSCRALQQHLQQLEKDARGMVERWQNEIRDRDLAEKRRVAPGWLDAEEGGRLLVPERKAEQGQGQSDPLTGTHAQGADRMRELAGGLRALELDGSGSREGEELDRAFGGPT